MSILAMVTILLRRLLASFRASRRHRGKPKVVIRRFSRHRKPPGALPDPGAATPAARPIRVATFNAAMFSMAPAVPSPAETAAAAVASSSSTDASRPKSILKPQQSLSRSGRLRVSINLPDNEISLETSRRVISDRAKGKAVAGGDCSGGGGRRSVLEVLREVGADIIGLQNVKAEEEKEMRPLSELAEGLGMRYVFAESWAPEYGNAVLSRWPIKRWRSVRVFDDSDFRNVLKVTVDVPGAGEVNFHCTHLDHLDERWRMKQINAVIRCADGPHILAGGLNALDDSDYSAERWLDIVKYYEKIGKPTPRVEVMNFLKAKQYVDAKHFAGECEAVVVAAKGQDVQGTCKYGTRVDYVLASPGAPYRFVPGSYCVVSSKGTSDHHIVRVDLTMQAPPEAVAVGTAAATVAAGASGRHRAQQQRVVKIDPASSPAKGIWAS